MNVIVTGAAGYIGGQTVLALSAAGYRVIGIDRHMPSTAIRWAMDDFLVSDFSETNCLHLIARAQPVAIVHCAGTSLVGPSILDPSTYYENNFVKTKCMLDYLVANKLTNIKLIFSSSAAVYGEPIMLPCSEEDPPMPISPYGESKLMVEFMLQAYHRAYDLKYTAFRYFNACGADPEGRHGQLPGATHIIARILESVRDNREFVLNGTDFDTPDGTCIRDYVHVEDLAQAHVLAVQQDVTGIFNLGTDQGHSNKEIIDMAGSVTEREVAVSTGPRRAGDPAQLTASPARWSDAAGWKPAFALRDIVQHAWTWYNR
jgi:UDP-glucose 4-epimerase